jgi:hypothetical protein
MKYFVFSVKILTLALIISFVFPILNTKYQILDTSFAYAQSVDLGIYPPVFQIQATTPSDVKIPFLIQNFTDSSVSLTIYLKSFTAAQTENGNITFLDTSNLPDPFLPQRIQVLDGDNSIGSLTLSPQQKKDLALAIQIPSNEPKGDYYLSLVFSSDTNNVNNRSSSQATIGIASNILLSIGPVGKTQGQIEDFSTSSLVAKGPIPFTIRVKNTSDHYITPKGNITIKNMFGQTIGKVNLLAVNILANTIRRIPDSIQANPNSKDYQNIKTEIDKNSFPVAIWPEKYLVGPYTATLSLALSDSGPLFTKEVVFFAFPLEYLIAILLVIGLIIFITIRVNHSRKNL